LGEAKLSLLEAEDPGNYRQSILTLITEKVMAQIILETISKLQSERKSWGSNHIRPT